MIVIVQVNPQVVPFGNFFYEVYLLSTYHVPLFLVLQRLQPAHWTQPLSNDRQGFQ